MGAEFIDLIVLTDGPVVAWGLLYQMARENEPNGSADDLTVYRRSKMNRIAKELAEALPQPKGPFTDAEALELLMAYRKDPSNVPCPLCGPDNIEVLAFIEPEIDPNGFASVTHPEGEYAAALYCHKCYRAVGILAGTGREV
jgi:hypothetical protein